MTLFIEGHAFGYELSRVAQMFFPGEKVVFQEGAPCGAPALGARLCGGVLTVSYRELEREIAAGGYERNGLCSDDERSLRGRGG